MANFKVGRKRKFGIKRQPNGQPSRERDVDPKALAQLMPHRREVPQELAHDPKAESVLGRLCLNGWITQIQYDAGVKYREIVMRYRAIIDSPRGEVSMSGIIVGPWGGGFTLEESEIERRKTSYNEAFEWLEANAGNAGCRAVANCAVHERNEFIPRHLRCGLDALAEHFGLTFRRKSPNAINRR